MLRVFPFTLTGAVKRWVDRLAPGTINTWDLLKKAFIQRCCPPFMTAKQLEDIYNFKQEGDKSLYQAWEWYNDLLYMCPTHDINSHQKVNIFYKGLSTMNRQLLDSQRPILEVTPAEALIAIQTMADHSQKWHDGTTSRNIRSSSSNDGVAALVNKLDNLGRDMKKLKESVHAIQFRVGPPGYYTKIDNRPPYAERRQSLEELLAKHQEEYARRSIEMEEKNTIDQLPTKESNPGHFTLPCTISNFNFYAMADLGASVNVLPRNIFKYLGLSNLNQTPNSTVNLGKPFLATIHAQISVFEKEISVGIGDERVTFNINRSDHNFSPTEGIFMLNLINTDEPITKRLKISDDTATKHFCKPIIHECDKDFKAWPSCNPLRNKCDGGHEIYGINELGKTKYWFFPNNYKRKEMKGDGVSFLNFLIIRYGGCQVKDSVWSKRKDLFRLWVIDKSTEALDLDEDPFGRCLDEYNWVFPKEIEQVTDEYEIKIREKGQVLEEIWTKCKRSRSKDKDWWYDYWIQKLGGNYRDRLDSYSFGNFAEIAAVTA
ncbi:hypothetical protein Tco_0563724 [Tanacetum coccineum]